MTSWILLNASVALATVAFNEAAPDDPARVFLRHVDTVLFILGLALLAALGIFGIARRKADPLACAPVRDNKVNPELLLAPIAAYVLACSAAQPLAKRLAEGHADEGAALATGSLGQIAAAAACIWVGHRFFRGGAWRFLVGDGHVGRTAVLGLVGLLISLPACELMLQATLWLFRALIPAYELVEHDVINALRDPSEPPWTFATLWVGSVLIAPVAEECFFRGLVQTVFQNAIRRRWISIVAAAILFGFAHHGQWHVVPAIATLGLILGIVYERTGSLVGPIVLHALFNLKTMVWEAYGAAGG